MRKSLRATAAAAAAVGLALLAGGCGGSGSTPTIASTSTPAQTTPSTTQGSSTASATTSPGSGGATAPGTQLALAKAAIVDYKPGVEGNSPSYRLEVSVLSIEKGSQADMDGVELDKAQQGQTPYYVRLKMRNIGAGDAAAAQGDPSVGFQATDDRGQQGQELSIIGHFRPCESTTEPTHITHGVTYETCVIYMVGAGGSIVQEEWTGSGADTYTEKPLVWKAS